MNMFLENLKTNKIRHLCAFILSIFSALLFSITPIISQEIIDKGIVGKSLQLVIQYVLLYISIIFVQSIILHITNVMYASIEKKYSLYKQEQVLQHISQVKGSEIHNANTGEYFNTISNDIPNVSECFSVILFQLVRDVFTTIFTVIIMFKLNFVIAISVIAIQILVIIFNRYFNNQYTPIASENRKLQDKRVLILNELIQNIFYLIQSNNSKYYISKYMQQENETQKKIVDIKQLLSKKSNIVSAIQALTIIIIWGYGGFLSINGILTLGNVYALSNYSNRLLGPFNRLIDLHTELKDVEISVKRINSVMNINTDTSNNSTIGVLDIGDINFSNVSFRYGDSTSLFSGLSMSFKKGESTAIVGFSGSGKTTIVNLLTGMYPVSNGAIFIGSQELKTITPSLLRESISYVSQHPIIFNDTVFNNIAMGRDISHEQIQKLLIDLKIDDIVYSLENGINTLLGENGSNLSGGQKQLITIARAIASNADIVILDEATSNLDNKREKDVMDRIYKLCSNKVLVIISHRLSIVEDANLIYFLQNGNIVEWGNHLELMKKRGKYYDFYTKKESC